ncbi:MAG: ChbG/HpnK family deacetylase [Alphaproteobacteria bacterium]|nr:ChbG/HpnK family deacetylase [Alphaproteobacteria bacterium]
MKSTVILCADDFGISAGVNRAILDLAERGKLSAVSCMSLGEAWAEGAKALKPLAGNIDVGLHLTFTNLPPLTKAWGEKFPSLKALIVRSWLRRLDAQAVEEEVRAQFHAFMRHWGRPPDFIDGHQHVHILPVIREALLKVRAELAPLAWMRNVVDIAAAKDDFKSMVLAVLGWRLLALMNHGNIIHNQFFRGAYDYSRPADFAALMARWLAQEEPVLVYCHPGFPDKALAQYDDVLEPRRKEYDFLSGAEWNAGLKESAVTLLRRPPAGAHALFALTRQLMRFLVTGGVNTLFGYFIYVCGVVLFRLSPFFAVVWSYVIGTTFSFATFRAFVFTDGARGIVKSYLRFIPAYVALFFVNELLLFAFVDGAGWNKLAAQAGIIPVCAALSFVINKIFVFK